MAKTRKQPAPDLPRDPHIGDKVTPERSELTFVIDNVRDGRFVDIHVPGTTLTRFHVDVNTLTFVD